MQKTTKRAGYDIEVKTAKKLSDYAKKSGTNISKIVDNAINFYIDKAVDVLEIIKRNDNESKRFLLRFLSGTRKRIKPFFK